MLRFVIPFITSYRQSHVITRIKYVKAYGILNIDTLADETSNMRENVVNHSPASIFLKIL